MRLPSSNSSMLKVLSSWTWLRAVCEQAVWATSDPLERGKLKTDSTVKKQKLFLWVVRPM